MYRTLKAVMAEFSYFMEKYFNITSSIWTVVFIAIIWAMLFAFICKGLEIILNRKRKIRFFPIYICSTILIGLLVNGLMISPEMWNSKLQRVKSNIEYVTSFPANRKIFFDALSIPDNDTNKDNVFKIAKALNEEQWNNVKKCTGDGKWYFEKVEKAIKEILKVQKYHVSLPVSEQYGTSMVPMLLLMILSVVLYIKHKHLDATLTIFVSILSYFFSFGGSIFLVIMMYAGTMLWLLFRFYQKMWTKRHIARIE